MVYPVCADSSTERKGDSSALFRNHHPMPLIKDITMIEQWLPVAGYEGIYEVSSLGMVRSIDRVIIKNNGFRYAFKGRNIRQINHSTGYLQVNLSCKNVQTSKLVHRLVADAFCKRPCGLNEVNHIDLNKRNNTPANLEWCTHKENQSHAGRNGRMSTVRGERKGASKLTAEQAADIKRMLADGARVMHIHAKYPFISRTPIYEIKNGTSWAHI